MNVLVVGLGSMGKRRVRNLRALDVGSIAGVDVREDRRAEAGSKYGIAVFADLQAALAAVQPSALVLSTPPQLHMTYAFQALELGLPCFIEASVVEQERVLELHRRTEKAGPVMAPSCTMRYFPGPKKVRELLGKGAIGRPINVSYHTGQFLRDWHPWEPIEDYYVSRRETGGCREIVPFELTWLNHVFGDPEPLACLPARVSELGVDIDDIYHCWLRYPGNVLANITVEVISRPQATRELRVLGTTGLLVWSADDQIVRVSSVAAPEWEKHALERGQAEAGYINPEEPYIDEMRDYLKAVRARDGSLFPNTLLQDYRVLEILTALEGKAIS